MFQKDNVRNHSVRSNDMELDNKPSNLIDDGEQSETESARS